MKKIAIFLMMMCVAFVSAQEEQVSIKEGNKEYKVKGDLVEVTIYYNNGQVEQHGFYKDKKLHGTWKSYDNKGNKLAIANYNNGKKTGKWLFWNGNTLKEVDYVDYKIASVNEWKDKTLIVSK